MEQVMAVYGWLQLHGVEIAVAVTSAIGTFSFFAKLTPTPKDDEIANKLHVYWTKAVDFLAMNKSRV